MENMVIYQRRNYLLTLLSTGHIQSHVTKSYSFSVVDFELRVEAFLIGKDKNSFFKYVTHFVSDKIS